MKNIKSGKVRFENFPDLVFDLVLNNDISFCLLLRPDTIRWLVPYYGQISSGWGHYRGRSNNVHILHQMDGCVKIDGGFKKI